MKTLKAWIYQWSDDKRLQDGQVLFRRLKKDVIKNLKVKETAVVIASAPNGKL